MTQNNQDTKPKFPSKDWFKVPKNRNMAIGICCAVVIGIVIAIMGITGVFGSGGDSGSNRFAFGQTAKLNDIEYTVQNVAEYFELSTPNMLTETTHSESGAKWIAVTIKAKNTKSYSGTVSASDFKLVAGETKYSVDTDSYTWYIDGNGADSIVGKEKLCYTNSIATIEASFSKSLILYFKVPQGTTLSDTYLSVTWAFDEAQMLLKQ